MQWGLRRKVWEKMAKKKAIKLENPLSELENALDEIGRGLVSYIIKDNTKYFNAAEPSTILTYIQKKKRQLEEKESSLKTILPKLQQRQKSAGKQQTATVYEGINGIKTMYNEILSTMKKGEEYYAIAVEPEIYNNNELQTFITNYHNRRAEKGIKVKLLADLKIKKEVTKTIAKSKLMQNRYFTQEVPSATLIYKNRVATFVWGKEPTAIVIQSSTIAKRYKNFFEEVWAKSN